MTAPGEAGFTGERLPGQGDEFAVDLERHLAAYRLARTYARAKRVLDAGCGEGYGAALLAEEASQVVGVDRAEAVTTARGRYARPNLRFEALDLTRLDRLGERFDVVVSFQVIEHLPEPGAYLAALRQRVAPGGVLIVTTPNRLMSVGENPYHLREWTAAELLALAAPILPGVQMLGVHASTRVVARERARGEQVARLLRPDPLGLRRLLPDAVVKTVFPMLARLVRRRLKASGEITAIGADDFQVHGHELSGPLDLVLLYLSPA